MDKKLNAGVVTFHGLEEDEHSFYRYDHEDGVVEHIPPHNDWEDHYVLLRFAPHEPAYAECVKNAQLARSSVTFPNMTVSFWTKNGNVTHVEVEGHRAKRARSNKGRNEDG